MSTTAEQLTLTDAAARIHPAVHNPDAEHPTTCRACGNTFAREKRPEHVRRCPARGDADE